MKKTAVEHSPVPVRTRSGTARRRHEQQGGRGPLSHHGGGTATAQKIGLSIAYMKQHLNQPLQVAVLTALIGVSPSHFFTLFKRTTGHTPIDFFIHLRMRRACELLQRTNLSVKEVAASLGYDDQFYFSRVFKSVNRVAPTEYRVQMTEPEKTNGIATIPLHLNGSANGPALIFPSFNSSPVTGLGSVPPEG